MPGSSSSSTTGECAHSYESMVADVKESVISEVRRLAVVFEQHNTVTVVH
jgi:hypothetical protein